MALLVRERGRTKLQEPTPMRHGMSFSGPTAVKRIRTRRRSGLQLSSKVLISLDLFGLSGLLSAGEGHAVRLVSRRVEHGRRDG